MSDIEKNETETRIVQAAEKVFLRDGFDGARMQDIADEADINKAMLHYYFRNKEKLFEQILLGKFAQFMPQMNIALADSSLDAIQRLEGFIDIYLDLLQANPALPLFIVNSVNRNPQSMLKQRGHLPLMLIGLLQEAIDKGQIKPIDPEQLVLSIMGMCIFPYLSRPLMEPILQKSPEAYDEMMQMRRQELKKYIRSILTI